MLFNNGTLAWQMELNFALSGAVRGWRDDPLVAARYDVCDDKGSRTPPASDTA